MDFSEASIMSFFLQFAYQPVKAYSFIFFFMLACAVVIPFPEELIILIAGLLANMPKNPDLFPPPYPGAPGVNTFLMCLFTFLAVFISDILVYFLGKYFGGWIINTKLFQKRFAGERFEKVNAWFVKYGTFASGIFRLIPGVRFPGHLSCGLMGIPLWKYMVVDGLAALIYVPVQIYLIAEYGNIILTRLADARFYAALVIGAVLVIWGIRKVIHGQRARNSQIS